MQVAVHPERQTLPTRAQRRRSSHTARTSSARLSGTTGVERKWSKTVRTPLGVVAAVLTDRLRQRAPPRGVALRKPASVSAAWSAAAESRSSPVARRGTHVMNGPGLRENARTVPPIRTGFGTGRRQVAGPGRAATGAPCAGDPGHLLSAACATANSSPRRHLLVGPTRPTTFADGQPLPRGPGAASCRQVMDQVSGDLDLGVPSYESQITGAGGS